MNQRRRPPETASGYYVLHDFRRIDWEAWTAMGEDDQTRTLAELKEFLTEREPEEGDIGCFSVIGHKADLLVLVLRETLAELEMFQRQFETLEFAHVTERQTSALGATEASGYTEAAASFFDPEADADPGIERYMHSRLYPELPDADFLSFYFMDKRRDAEHNWYDLPYEERADHVGRHGEIGKEFAGRVTQMITGTMGYDDWEWGVTLFTDDMNEVKELLTAMRFDPSTSRFAEFGPFYVAQRFSPMDMDAWLAGEALASYESTGEGMAQPAIEEATDLPIDVDIPSDAHAVILLSEADPQAVQDHLDELRGHFEHYDSHLQTTTDTAAGQTAVVSAWTTERAVETAAGFLADLPGVTQTERRHPGGGEAEDSAELGDEAVATDVREALAEAGVYAGQPHGEDVHALVVYSHTIPAELADTIEPMVADFRDDPDHTQTSVYASREHEVSAVVSLWDDPEAARSAANTLEGVPDIEQPQSGEGFMTMGLFYRVKPEHRESFVETFAGVEEALRGMEGHENTELFVQLEDPNDMFISSQWREKEDAMSFFRSDAFRETVEFGRDVLADRPRHVFLV